MELKSLLLILFSCIFMRPLKVAMVTAPKYTDEKYRHTKNQRPGYVIKKKISKSDRISTRIPIIVGNFD